MPKPRYNQKINLTIKDLGRHGEGVGYWHGYTVFVDGALPHEVIEARMTQCRRNCGQARISRLVQPSPARVEPPCPFFDRCGGCQLMHMSYPDQLAYKRQRIVNAFLRFDNLQECPIAPCRPSPEPLAYRNKIQLPVRLGEQGLELGLYARQTHALVSIDHCLVHCELGETVFQLVQKLLQETSLTAYDEISGEGELRTILIRTAIHANQALVAFVTNGPPHASLEALAHQLMQLCPEVVGVVHNSNTARDNSVLGDQFHTLAGSDHLQESLLGLTFKISAASFFQVNTGQAEQLYTAALDGVEIQADETVLDLYCGVGTLSLLAAARGAQVIGIESNAEAVQDAEENRALNGLSHVRFQCGDVEQLMPTIAHADAALVNPPRKGCEPTVIEALCRLKPTRIAYISCDPLSLARDLSFLVTQGYGVQEVIPFDMFPQTAHVECLALLKLK